MQALGGFDTNFDVGFKSALNWDSWLVLEGLLNGVWYLRVYHTSVGEENCTFKAWNKLSDFC